MQGGEIGRPATWVMCRDGKGGIAAGFAARGVNQSQMRAVDQQADRHFRLAQQPLEAMVRCSLPLTRVRGGDLIEVGAGGDDLDEHRPGIAGILGLDFLDRVCGLQRVVVFGNATIKESVCGSFPSTGVRSPGSQPTICVKAGTSAILGIGSSWASRGRQAGASAAAERCCGSHTLGPMSARDGNDQADRLNVADPFLMGDLFGVLHVGVQALALLLGPSLVREAA